MKEAADLTAAWAAVATVRNRFFDASDEELLADLDAIERIGRLVDGLRVAAAAEVEHRSRPTLGFQGLAQRNGARNAAELLEQTIRIDHRDAQRRIGIGAALAPRRGLLTEPLPGRYPALTDAVMAGSIALDAARVIVEAVKPIRFRATPDAIDSMVESLVDTAAKADLPTLREAAEYWSLALDPDGAEPQERERRRKRALKIGRTLADGTTAVNLVMLPEHLAVLRELLQSRRRSVPLVRTEAGSDHPAEPLEPEWREDADPEADDPRSRVQQDYDTLTDALSLAVRAEASGFDGSTTTHQVIVTATVADIEAREGAGWAAGVLAGLPVPSVEQLACTAETRLQVSTADGEPLFLSRTHRLFSPAQKLALTTAAQGRCEYPGCRVPSPYLEAHHVRWFERDAGPTDLDNGIMLCSYHHHLVHLKDGPVEIRRHEGQLYVVPRAWTDAPGMQHRARRHLAEGRVRRAPHPWIGLMRTTVPPSPG